MRWADSEQHPSSFLNSPSRPNPKPGAGDGASGEVFEAMWRRAGGGGQLQRVAVKVFVQERSPDGHSRDEMAVSFSGACELPCALCPCVEGICVRWGTGLLRRWSLTLLSTVP